jgi:RNA polymerase sigma-70 factor (ECF subfamily)
MTTRSADEAAFRDLFNSTYQALVAYARRRSIDVGEADDIVSEVYAIAWRRRADLAPDSPSLPWLYGIAANVMRNQWRASTRRLQLVERLEAEPQPGPSGDPADRAGAEIRSALERLSFDDQEVLRLVAWEGLSHEAVGHVLGCTTNAVGIRIHRARQRLEKELYEQQRRGGAAS